MYNLCKDKQTEADQKVDGVDMKHKLPTPLLIINFG